MSNIPASLLEVREHNELGYKPLIDYQSWREDLMNYTAELLSEKINRMQKHVETDEVFVLLTGRWILFLGEGNDAAAHVHATDMKPFQLYNVKRGAWHSHTFNEDAKVLIVENHDTVDVNSPFVYLMPGQCQQVINVSSG